MLPPAGIPDNQLDRIQRELLNYGNLLQPPYFPLLGIEQRDGKNVLVLWCSGGQNRPYKAPKDVTATAKEYAYYIRHYANSVVAKNGELRELMALAATVPFDDRINHHAVLDDLKLPLVRSFLKDVKSDLYSRAGRMPFPALCRQMAIIDGPDEAPKPRNVGLIFFSEAPERFFPGTQIDIVYLPGGAGGDRLEEQVFRGPVHQQLRDALRHIQNRVIRERVTKLPDQAEAVRVFNYPFAAVEESLVNAIYHRGYDQREPVEVRISPDRIEVVSYPGPDASIRREALNGDRIVARRYRNRRIGEFLKELDLTEGRSTGIPKIRESMRRNGSPSPRFDTDAERTYFLAELPIHPAFLEAHDEAHVAVTETERRILRILRDGPRGVPELAFELGYHGRSGHLKNALDRLDDLGLIDLTIPDKPRGKNQKRQLTPKGRRTLDKLDKPKDVS